MEEDNTPTPCPDVIDHCPFGTPIDLCKNKNIYVNKDAWIRNGNYLMYQEKTCIACQFWGPLTDKSCWLCNKVLDDIPDYIKEELLKEDNLKGIDFTKFHPECYGMAQLNLVDTDSIE